jgi:hypothetical protein
MAALTECLALTQEKEMSSRKVLRCLIYCASACSIAVATAVSAQAWTWNNQVTVYNGSDLCVKGTAGIDHVIPGLFSGNLAYSYAYALRPGCGAGLNLPYGWAATRLDVYKWTGTQWAICRGSSWAYGSTGTDQWGLTGPQQILDYGRPTTCGRGYYGTLAYAYVWNGSAWRSGSVWSGYEYVLQ